VSSVAVFRYRLYPTKAQAERMSWTCERLRELYNSALEERREAYRRQRVSLSEYGQSAELSAVREARPEYARIHVHLLQDALTRLDRAYRSFFRRLKAGERAGFPRFRGRGRYSTFTFKDCKTKKHWLVAGGRRLSLSGIGNIKIKLHRPVDGRLKQVTVTLGGDGHWYACLCCDEVTPKTLPKTGASVGIDVGITSFAALSTGDQVANPRHYESAHAKLRRAQRVVARRKRGSNRRRKAAAALRAHHDRIRRARLDFHHKVALDIVQRFDRIAVENLNVRGLAAGRLAKQVNDAAWAQFTRILESKAECAGREFFRVDPRGTSQECSGCGSTVKKDLSVRIHNCPGCGLVLDRDENAARNIMARAEPSGREAVGRPGDPRSRERSDANV
jgi:putative transposase